MRLFILWNNAKKTLTSYYIFSYKKLLPEVLLFILCLWAFIFVTVSRGRKKVAREEGGGRGKWRRGAGREGRGGVAGWKESGCSPFSNIETKSQPVSQAKVFSKLWPSQFRAATSSYQNKLEPPSYQARALILPSLSPHPAKLEPSSHQARAFILPS